LSRRIREETDLNRGKMTVQEAGKKGGAKGGPRVRELTREGKEFEQEKDNPLQSQPKQKHKRAYEWY